MPPSAYSLEGPLPQFPGTERAGKTGSRQLLSWTVGFLLMSNVKFPPSNGLCPVWTPNSHLVPWLPSPTLHPQLGSIPSSPALQVPSSQRSALYLVRSEETGCPVCLAPSCVRAESPHRQHDPTSVTPMGSEEQGSPAGLRRLLGGRVLCARPSNECFHFHFLLDLNPP